MTTEQQEVVTESEAVQEPPKKAKKASGPKKTTKIKATAPVVEIKKKDLATIPFEEASFLRPRSNPNIHIIGAGGIGGNLVYNLYRDRAALYQRYNQIYLYDGDVVEMKNLMRQNFANKDIGKNKASVIADRYKEFLNITAVPTYFNAKFTTDNIRQIDTIASNDIIISCVDNVKTRLDILDEINSIFHELTVRDVPLFIDSGNETYHGSLVFCHNAHISQAYFDHLKSRAPKKSDAPYDKSCADVQPQDEGFVQIYTVNMMAAMYDCIFLSNYLTKCEEAKTSLVDWNLYQKYAPVGVMFSLTTTRNIDITNDFTIQENTQNEKAPKKQKAVA